MTRNVLALSILALSTGCEGGDYLPSIAFDRLDVKDLTWDDVESDFVFKVDNPNPLSITLTRFDYTLSFKETEWLAGDDPDGLTLAADGSSDLALPAHIVFEELYNVVQATKGEDDIPFRLKGSFGFDTPIGEVNLPYDADGSFPALRTPKVDFSKLRVADLTFTTADIEVDLAVNNEHGSNLWFQNFDYDIDLGNNDVGQGIVSDLGVADGATESTLTLPLQVDLVETGSAVYDILTGQQAQIGLTAGTDVDTPFGVIPLTIDETGNVTIQ